MRNIRIKIGGEAGAGVNTVGFVLSKCLQRCGLRVFSMNDYPSLIRGGHNVYTVNAGERDMHCHLEKPEFLVALNKDAVLRHHSELEPGGKIIYDSDVVDLDDVELQRGIERIPVPFASLAAQAGDKMYANTVAAGACASLVGVDFRVIEGVLNDQFSRKGDLVVKGNVSAAKLGYEHMTANTTLFARQHGTIFVTGNEAVCLGAIKAGCRLVAEYPMTPSSSILHYMAANEYDYNIVVKHTEDEIAAVNMLVGAAFAGARAMTATSGGGFSLMVEGMGFAGMSEAPIVIVEAQRTGPSTGMPTYHEQADLQFVLHASQGEFPRVVVAPGDVEECFYEGFNAFNLADKLQTPVLILLDKYISESAKTMAVPEKALRIERGKLVSSEAAGMKRYELTKSGASPRIVPPAASGMHVSSSYEHDETGFSTEDPLIHAKMHEKRMRKMGLVPKELIRPKMYGSLDSKMTIIGFGSTKGPALEALRLLEADGKAARYMHVAYLHPLDADFLRQELESSEQVLDVECNLTGQLASLIREKTGFEIREKLLRYDGRPVDPSQIYEKVREMLL